MTELNSPKGKTGNKRRGKVKRKNREEKVKMKWLDVGLGVATFGLYNIGKAAYQGGNAAEDMGKAAEQAGTAIAVIGSTIEALGEQLSSLLEETEELITIKRMSPRDKDELWA